MIWFLVITGSVLLAFYLYLRSNVLLPSNIETMIKEVKSKPLSDPIIGPNHQVDNQGISINYEIIPTKGKQKGHVFLINGHSQTMLAYPLHFYQPLLDVGYTVIRMDNRGLGLSSWMKDWTKENAYALEDMASDVIAVLDDIGVKKVHLIGMSMGGMIAQTVAINYPERVHTLSSIMSTGFYDDPALVSLPPKFYRDLVLVVILYRRNLEQLDNKLKIHLAINRLLHGKGYKFDDKLILRRALAEISLRKGYNKYSEAQHTRAIFLSGSRYESLKTLQIPTLVIHGTADTLVKFEHGEKYAKMIPNAKTLFIDGMGHHLPLKHTPMMIENILELFETVRPH